MIIKDFITYKGLVSSLSDEQKREFQANKIRWYFSSMSLSVLSFIFVLLSGFFSGESNVLNWFENGELVFASFTLLPDIIIDCLHSYKKAKENSKSEVLVLGLAMLCILLSFCHVYIYGQIKAVEDMKITVITAISAILFLITLLFANYTKNNLILIDLER